MDKESGLIDKYVSIIYRMGMVYFDEYLSSFHIGCGQQFFLMNISTHPGMSQLELTQIGGFDQATTARAVKKLEESGFIRRMADEKDKRINKLYVTEAAAPILQATMKMLNGWRGILTEGMTESEKTAIGILLERMSENARNYIKKEHQR